jgi:hypothetical protein
VRTLAEATLAVVLFSDSARINLGAVVKRHSCALLGADCR